MAEKIYIPGQSFEMQDIADPRGTPFVIESSGKVSDGYHTFDELYEHRNLLFCLASYVAFPADDFYTWKSKTHWIDGRLEPVWEGWFIAGIDLGEGSKDRNGNLIQESMITYHLPLAYWELFNGIDRECAPPHDGHDSHDVIERIKEFLKS